MEKKRKPFNAKLFYRRTCLIIYDIISVVIASYMAILWRYDFHLDSIGAYSALQYSHNAGHFLYYASVQQSVGFCRRNGASEYRGGLHPVNTGRQYRPAVFQDNGPGGAEKLLSRLSGYTGGVYFCQPFFLPVLPGIET